MEKPTRNTRKNTMETASTAFHPMTPIREFLLTETIFNHRVISEKIGVHKSAISLFLSGRSSLSKENTKKLINLMEKYGYKDD